MYCNPLLRKAVAFSLFVKNNTASSVIKNWNINKLHMLTGVSANVVSKRVSTLREYGLIAVEGMHGEHLVFKSLHSNTSHRNIALPSLRFVTDGSKNKNSKAQQIKSIEDMLAAMLLVEIQKHKNYAEQTIQKSLNPSSKKEYKKATKTCNRLNYGRKFVDNGISYKYMAKKIGFSTFSAQNLVKFAVKHHLVEKIKTAYKKIHGIGKYIEDMVTGYTFYYHNSIYKIYANRYALIHHGNY